MYDELTYDTKLIKQNIKVTVINIILLHLSMKIIIIDL